MTDLERLLQASIDLHELRAKLDAAHTVIVRQKRVIDAQANELAILRARCRLSETRLARLTTPRNRLQAG